MTTDSLEPDDKGKDKKIKSAYEMANKKEIKPRIGSQIGRPERDLVITEDEIINLKIDLNIQTADEFIGGL